MNWENYECDGQMDLFSYIDDGHTSLIRKNEYESWRCKKCGTECPQRIIYGDWPYQGIKIADRCPGCKRKVDLPEDLIITADLANNYCLDNKSLCNRTELWELSKECPQTCCFICEKECKYKENLVCKYKENVVCKSKKKAKPKPLKYYMSLSAYYTKCPYCGAENCEKEIQKYVYECQKCHTQAIGYLRIESKDLKEVEALGLTGAVTKDDKGRWAEVHYDGKGNRYLTYGGGNDAQK